MSTNPQSQQAAEATTTTLDAANPLDQLVASTMKSRTTVEQQRNKTYIEEFVKSVIQPGQIVSKDVEANINYWISEIDRKLTVQINEILHQPEFQKLESTWRGLHYLVHQSETGENLKIRVLNCKKSEIYRDLDRAVEFDQSTLFKKIYEAEYGQLGGTPYGMLIGDFEFERTTEDIEMLKKLSGVAAASHAPFVSNASPKLFDMESYEELSKPRDLAKIFDSVDYTAWKSFRESEDSRYVALTLPRVLARVPYGDNFKKVDQFKFEENVDGSDHSKYLWMGAAWAYGARVTDAFAKNGWFANTRGVKNGGKIEGLPVHTFLTDEGGKAMKCPAETAISDRREYELSNLGFLPVVHAKNTDYAVFMGSQSCQKAKKFQNNPNADASAELSTKLNHMLCVSRFAHYLKVMARDMIGSNMEKSDVEVWLNDWIKSFVISNPSMVSDEERAKAPLQDARVDVREVKGKPGHYEAVAYLRPHFQLEGLGASMRLVASVPERKG